MQKLLYLKSCQLLYVFVALKRAYCKSGNLAGAHSYASVQVRFLVANGENKKQNKKYG